MPWTIDVDGAAERDLRKLGHEARRRITSFLSERLSTLEDPRLLGEALTGSRLGNLWKYRVGDYRIIADIQDKEVRVLIVRIGHRRSIYLSR